MTGPLSGIRIVDASAMITGPQATMILADQGAEVIKIEPPGHGDVMRQLGTARAGMSAFFAAFNRGKRSIVIDLRHEPGRVIARSLVARADVFVQNFRPGVIERLGLGEPTLRALRPDLVYVSINAFGEKGPFADRPAYDHIIQGFTGMPRVQGNPLTGRPDYVKMAWCDKITGHTAAQAITAALFARQRGAGGQHLRLSMLDAALAFFWPDGMMNHTILEDDADIRPPIAASYQFVEASDGFVSVAAITDAQWHGIFRAVARPDMVDDPRFATMEGRSKNLLALLTELGGGKVDMTCAEALERLTDEDVPCGPMLTLEEVPDHPQVVESGTLVESVHPVMGRIREPRPAARFSRTLAPAARPAPGLGEHTDEILAEAGIAASNIAGARASGALG